MVWLGFEPRLKDDDESIFYDQITNLTWSMKLEHSIIASNPTVLTEIGNVKILSQIKNIIINQIMFSTTKYSEISLYCLACLFWQSGAHLVGVSLIQELMSYTNFNVG